MESTDLNPIDLKMGELHSHDVSPIDFFLCSVLLFLEPILVFALWPISMMFELLSDDWLSLSVRLVWAVLLAALVFAIERSAEAKLSHRHRSWVFDRHSAKGIGYYQKPIEFTQNSLFWFYNDCDGFSFWTRHGTIKNSHKITNYNYQLKHSTSRRTKCLSRHIIFLALLTFIYNTHIILSILYKIRSACAGIGKMTVTRGGEENNVVDTQPNAVE